MGRSRRRTQKYRTKVSIKKKRVPQVKSKLPEELKYGRTSVSQKLGLQPNWDPQDGLEDNYAANGFLADPNAGFGRNLVADPLKDKVEVLAGADEEVKGYESDDDLRQVEGKPRRDGKRAEIAKPTGHQRRIIAALIAAHGEDIEGMVKDTKLNRMLLPASKLKRLIAGYHKFGDSAAGRCGFRTPVKHL